MLIDFIEPSKLPDFVVWFDWQLYAHPVPLFVIWAIISIVNIMADESVKFTKLEQLGTVIINYSAIMYLVYGGGVG